MVFAGYGLTIPEYGHDDLEGLDVDGKVVVMIDGAPASVPSTVAAHYSSGTNTLRNLRRRGAAGVLFVNERVTVTLTRLTITGGNATVRVGGGIQNVGILTLNRSTVTGNRSASDGGGIYNYGNLTLNDSRLTANTAGGGGGGLFSEGVATLNRSAVTGNTAAYGGGILSVNTLTLNQTTVSGNVPDDCAC